MKLVRVQRGVYRIKYFRIDYVHDNLWLVYDESRCPNDFAIIVFNSRSLKTTKAWITKQLKLSASLPWHKINHNK